MSRRQDSAGRSGPRDGRIRVLAGVNGAGKSSVLGEHLRRSGSSYFNPDEVARRLRTRYPAMTEARANGAAWEIGRRKLERAIRRGQNFTFETTLGGQTITDMLHQAVDAGLAVEVHYVGLDSPERHIARVRDRVARGGHPIPDAKIRERYDQSRRNLLTLVPRLARLRVFDNSAEAAPLRGTDYAPVLLVHLETGRLAALAPQASVPVWARPIVAAALRTAKAAEQENERAGRPAPPPTGGAPP